ncbi:protein ELFN1 [Denticeps clupeoides]|uniref:ELFN1/ELFN2 fibronectin type-III domain-containing protein n=1 Tax=Denticeps clupeoides TaxID=299321 RepID=A0AAY4C4A8_9TELE|nr:protein ELFN1-like [Denticeps clupeoides]XP_028827944.1 protein ELFN1-like [Denticeps clupeoides]
MHPTMLQEACLNRGQGTSPATQTCAFHRGLPAAAWLFLLLSFSRVSEVRADCWLIEGEKGFVWLAICSQNQPPFESVPLHINSTIVDLRLNENKIRSIHYSSLSRFGNLTYLNLTKNDISYVEDGAFSAQFNLQVLQMGFNRLRNLTEGILRGLGKLQYLYLQANLIETVTPNTFWECPNIENVDLSMNRIQVLDGATFSGLQKLTTCELYSNPFSCTCELLPFLQWLAVFPNRTSERMACESPTGFSGYNLLSQNPRTPAYRNALHALNTVCTGDNTTPYLIGQVDGGGATISLLDLSPCGADDCPSGTPPEEPVRISSTVHDLLPRPTMKLKHLQPTPQGHMAVISVQIPDPFRKMYILMLYNNSFHTDIQTLTKHREDVEFRNLKSHTEYTYCVVSTRNSLRFNETCLTIPTGPKTVRERLPGDSKATHYIMTVLGSLFSMLIVLGVVYHCLRRKRKDEERQKKLGKMKKNLIELRYGGELEGSSGISQLSQKQQQLLAGEGPPVKRMPYLPSGGGAGDVEPYKVQEIGETPAKSSKGNYMEVRREEPVPPPPLDRDRECPGVSGSTECENTQSSVAEISTIAKEVDKVNQIINNCIDALKSESTSFQGVKSGAVSTAEPQLMLISDHPTQQQSKSGFLSPVYKGRGYPPHPLQRHHSMEAPTPKRPSTSSSGSVRSPRSFRSEGAYRSENKYIENASVVPAEPEPLRSVTPAAVILRAEAERIRQYGEHRHSYPGSHHPGTEVPERPGSASRKASILEPLTRSRPRELSYSQLSPEYHNLSTYSSPEYSCRPSLSLWERFKLHRKRHRDQEEYVAAGHALRRKVQFARDEDLHDILDYWKGVSAQQKC